MFGPMLGGQQNSVGKPFLGMVSATNMLDDKAIASESKPYKVPSSSIGAPQIEQ